MKISHLTFIFLLSTTSLATGQTSFLGQSDSPLSFHPYQQETAPLPPISIFSKIPVGGWKPEEGNCSTKGATGMACSVVESGKEKEVFCSVMEGKNEFCSLKTDEGSPICSVVNSSGGTCSVKGAKIEKASCSTERSQYEKTYCSVVEVFASVTTENNSCSVLSTSDPECSIISEKVPIKNRQQCSVILFSPEGQKNNNCSILNAGGHRNTCSVLNQTEPGKDDNPQCSVFNGSGSRYCSVRNTSGGMLSTCSVSGTGHRGGAGPGAQAIQCSVFNSMKDGASCSVQGSVGTGDFCSVIFTRESSCSVIKSDTGFCSVSSSATDNGAQCSTQGGIPLPQQCSVIGTETASTSCSVVGNSNIHFCSVNANDIHWPKPNAFCSVKGSGTGAYCSIEEKTGKGQCSVTSTHNSGLPPGGSCSTAKNPTQGRNDLKCR